MLLDKLVMCSYRDTQCMHKRLPQTMRKLCMCLGQYVTVTQGEQGILQGEREMAI